MQISRYFTTRPDGNPVPNGTEVELRLHADNTLLATEETTNGWATFILDGSPGPHYIRCLYNSETQVVSSKATGVSLATDIANLPLLIRTYESGYVRGVLGSLAVTAAGTSMNVTVAGGAAYVRGVLYDQAVSRNHTLAGPASQPRIDTIVVEVVPPGNAAEGRSRVMVKQGTPAASPVAPSLTQTTALWEFPLADVRVNPSVASITNAVVTDRRVEMSPFIRDKYITKAMLADTATPGVLVAKSGVEISPHARMINFTDEFLLQGYRAGDYSDPKYPYATIALNKPSLLAYIEANLDISSTPVTPLSFEFNDFNFNGKGNASYSGSGTSLHTGIITLPPGTWVIESELNFSVRGVSSGWSQFTTTLSGTGASTSSDQSSRIFDAVQGVPRMIVLSSRRQVTPTASTQYNVTGHAKGRSGTVEILSGVLRMRAFRRS